MLTLSIFIGNAVKADYQCVNDETGATLTVKEYIVTHFGGDTIIYVDLKNGESIARYDAIADTNTGGLYSKTVYKFFPDDSDTLTLISQPQSCGRTLCIGSKGDPMITALLKIDEKETYFSCD